MAEKIIKLLNNREAAMKVHANGEPVLWAVGETIAVTEKEAAFLLTYEGVMEAGKFFPKENNSKVLAELEKVKAELASVLTENAALKAAASTDLLKTSDAPKK